MMLNGDPLAALAGHEHAVKRLNAIAHDPPNQSLLKVATRIPASPSPCIGPCDSTVRLVLFRADTVRPVSKSGILPLMTFFSLMVGKD